MPTYRSAALDALGDPTRRLVFELLGSGGRSVGELADLLPVSRPAVSQHLKVLHDAGLVQVRAEGTRRIYQVDPAGVAALRDYFDRFWTESLTAFKRAAEESFTGMGSTGTHRGAPATTNTTTDTEEQP